MSVEVELKLKLNVDTKSAASVARLPLFQRLATEKPTTRVLKSIYFDTSDADLRRSHLTLRLRRIGQRWLQTLKNEGDVAGGPHVRGESEDPVAFGGLDLNKIEDAALRRKLGKWLAKGELMPRFETVVRRTTWLLSAADGAAVECALDRGQVRTSDGRGNAPLCELELELKSGSPSALFAIARELAQSIPLALEDRSKAERGYMLWRREPLTKPSKAGTLLLHANANVGEALAQIAGSGLKHLQRNWHSAQAGSRYDPEHVHQMRVASRRLRTAFTLFGQTDSALKAHPLVGELRWLAGLLGDARNWDVLLAETLPRLLAAFPDEPGLLTLERRARIQRQHVRRAVGEALRSPRYFSLVLNLNEFVIAVRERPVLSLSVLPVAAKLLARCDRQLRKRAKHLAECSMTERHAVRIAAKKSRYTAEFFSSLFPGAKVDNFLRHSSALQDALGLLNDLAIARGLMSAPALHQNPEALQALKLSIDWANSLEERTVTELARCWGRVKRSARFWPDIDGKLDSLPGHRRVRVPGSGSD